MPKKGADRRKGRRNRNATGNNGATPSTNVKTSPQQTRGRNTKNSRQGRNNPPRSSTTAVHNHPKKTSTFNRSNRQGKSKSSHDQPIYFTSPTGELYKPGDFAYVDSQQPDLPFHICLIRSFKLARKESVIAEVKWFYRVTELPEAVYCLLMEDRKKGSSAASFEPEGIKERELFTAFNIDTHPAALFKGKCVVKDLSEVKNIAEYITKSNHFFYQHGYKPESRRITQLNEFSIIPQSQQAVLPDTLCTPLASLPLQNAYVNSNPSVNAPEEQKNTEEPFLDRYTTSVDQKMEANEELIWHPGKIEDDSLLMYLRASRSVALHAGVFINGLMRDGYMAASSDETTQHAFDVLHKVDYNTEVALLDTVKKPIVNRLYNKKNWSKENSLLFAKGMRQFGKNFFKIKKELLPNKEIQELIEYYYYWKKTNAGLSSRNTRKQRKQTHIKMSRNVFKQPELSPEREFIDLTSASEDEIENDDGEKCLSFHACRHCYTTASSSWHHAGSDKAILCVDCRVHFQRYGFMRSISRKRDPPDFMFKDYHLALAEESGRKTRNSNGIRLPRTGLRNGKVFSKSDSDDEDEEGDITDTSEFSSTESATDMHSVSNPKALPSRRSLLDLLQTDKSKPPSTSSIPSSSNTSIENEGNMEEPPNKRVKMEDNEGNETDYEASGDSTTNGEQEDDGEAEGNSSQQSREEKDSSNSHSPDSNNDGRNISHIPSVTTPSATATLNKDLLLEPVNEPVLDPVPQQFKRVRGDNEHSCARTDLVYVHPPAHEKKAIAAPQKTVPAHLPQLNFSPSSLPQPQPLSSIIPPPPSSTNHPSAFLPIHPPLPQHISQSQHRAGIPTITPHDPTLPPFINFPVPPHPMTPIGTPFVNIPASVANVGIQPQPIPPPSAHANDREKEILWRLQKQQMELAQAQAQGNVHHLPPGVHFHPPPSVPHTHHPGTATGQQQQPLIFQFPNMEEIARAQRHGIPEGLSLMPNPQFPQLVATTPSGLPLEARPQDDQNMPNIQYATLHPGISLEMLQQQAFLQQQQQPVIGHLPENIELYQQVEAIVQQSQKNPTIMFHPQVRNILAQYQAAQEMYVQQHHMQELMLHQMQQQQQEALKQQQKQQQPKYHQATGAAMRPGVIISNSK